MGGSQSGGKTRSLRIHQSIAQKIGIAILSGEYLPGQNLGGEIDQALTLGVSRTAYREAIRILVAKGLLESRPKAGTHVTPRAHWNLLDPDILAWMFSSADPDERFIRDLFELRGLIEPAAAALAARRHKPEHVAAMREALARMHSAGLATPQGREADQRFHSLLLAAADNEPLASLSSSVGAAVTWTTRFKQRGGDIPRDPHEEHLAVMQAIAAGDAEAARAAMEELLRLALLDMGVTVEPGR